MLLVVLSWAPNLCGTHIPGVQRAVLGGYESLTPAIHPYWHEAEVGEKFKTTREMMNVWCKCKHERDHVNELYEFAKRASVFMEKEENVDDVSTRRMIPCSQPTPRPSQRLSRQSAAVSRSCGPRTGVVNEYTVQPLSCTVASHKSPSWPLVWYHGHLIRRWRPS